MLKSQAAINLLAKEFEKERIIDSLVSGWLLLVKMLLLRPRTCTSASFSDMF